MQKIKSYVTLTLTNNIQDIPLSLFKKNPPPDVAFNKIEIIADITNVLALDYAKWTVFKLNGFPVDLLLIKSTEVQQETTIKYYSKVHPMIYQIVIGIDVKGPDEQVKVDMDIECLSKYLIVDSVKPVIRLLKEYT